MVCNNADICAYLDAYLPVSTSSISDHLVSGGDINNWSSYAAAALGYPGDDVINYYGSGRNLFDDISNLLTRLGIDNVDSHTVFQLLNLANSDAHSAYTNTNTLLTNLSNLDVAVGYTSHSPSTLYADIQSILSSLTIFGGNITTLLTDIVSVQTTLSQVALGIVASWPKSGGGNLIQAIGDWLLSQKTGPGVAHYTVGTYHPIISQQVVSIPTGAYGCRLELTVPSGWGKLDNWPFYYVPPVARIDYASQGFYGFDPIPVNTDFVLCTPFPPWADSMVVSLGVGVTANRAWLTL